MCSVIPEELNQKRLLYDHIKFESYALEESEGIQRIAQIFEALGRDIVVCKIRFKQPCDFWVYLLIERKVNAFQK